VKHLRTGISWADSFRPNAHAWFDRQMQSLDEFATTITLCFTPDHLGQVPHYTSPPKNPEGFAEFAAWVVERYAGAPKCATWQSVSACTPEHAGMAENRIVS
jgi:hypothetical protein